MNARYMVMAILCSCEDYKLEGKTNMQKLAFFSNLRTGSRITFKPHYYGPFSRQIDVALYMLTDIGMIREEIESLPESKYERSLHEAKKYKYQLTEEGKVFCEQLRKKLPSEFEEVKDTVTSIKNELGYFDPNVLSLASKIRYLEMETGKDLGPEEIETLSSNIGWEIEKEDIAKIKNFLSPISSLTI
jgi:uncharacterized protein YwgA